MEPETAPDFHGLADGLIVPLSLGVKGNEVELGSGSHIGVLRRF